MQTNNFEETRKVGEDFAGTLKGGDVVCLKGDLGAGKTTFMQGLAKGLGITHRIISPTFIIMRSYDVPRPVILGSETTPESDMKLDAGQASMTIKRLYHIDLYRTESIADLEGLGLPEILQEKDAVVAIEWSEKLNNLLPQKRWELHFQWMTENEREITMQHYE